MSLNINSGAYSGDANFARVLIVDNQDNTITFGGKTGTYTDRQLFRLSNASITGRSYHGMMVTSGGLMLFYTVTTNTTDNKLATVVVTESGTRSEYLLTFIPPP